MYETKTMEKPKASVLSEMSNWTEYWNFTPRKCQQLNLRNI